MYYKYQAINKMWNVNTNEFDGTETNVQFDDAQNIKSDVLFL